MNLIDISTNLAASLFPDETWEEQYKNVFVANSRKPKNSEQKAVFEKELLMARIASDNGHIVFLLPEIPIKKNPDALLDAEFTEFKSVSGGENAVSHRFRDALHQGQNVYLKIDSNITVKRIKQIIAGVLKEKENTGKVYFYISAIIHITDISVRCFIITDCRTVTRKLLLLSAGSEALMLEQIFLGFTGLCSGFIIAGGLTGLMIGLSIIPRYAGITHTADHILLYEDIIFWGTELGNLFFLFHWNIRFGTPFLILYGLFSGIFLGGWIMALAEMADIFPIFARRSRFL